MWIGEDKKMWIQVHRRICVPVLSRVAYRTPGFKVKVDLDRLNFDRVRNVLRWTLHSPIKSIVQEEINEEWLNQND